jgi:hypothetical protein
MFACVRTFRFTGRRSNAAGTPLGFPERRPAAAAADSVPVEPHDERQVAGKSYCPRPRDLTQPRPQLRRPIRCRSGRNHGIVKPTEPQAIHLRDLHHSTGRHLWKHPRWCGGGVSVCVRRCPTFPPGLGSIIGAGWLSFRVRDGSGRFPAAIAAVTLFCCVPPGLCWGLVFWWWGGCLFVWDLWLRVVWVSFRPVSASSLSPLRGV